jgi:hypothetical protein
VVQNPASSCFGLHLVWKRDGVGIRKNTTGKRIAQKNAYINYMRYILGDNLFVEVETEVMPLIGDLVHFECLIKLLKKGQ